MFMCGRHAIVILKFRLCIITQTPSILHVERSTAAKEEFAIKIYLKFSAFLCIFIRLHPEEILCSEIKWQKVIHHHRDDATTNK